MAASKKARRKKAPARKSAPRKKAVKTVRKPARKAPARRAASRTTKRVARPAVRAKPQVAAARAPQAAAPPGQRIGVITHYYGHLSVAVIKLEGATLRVGDTIHIRGFTTDFSQRVESLQVEHQSVPEVGPQDDFGLKVRNHVREHDVVYRVRP